MSSNTPRENLNLRESTIVRAGAGAGKTTALIQRFIDYAHQFKDNHGRWPRIVLTTFTKKATHEIRERLFQKALANQQLEFLEYINSKSSVQITTIHGLLLSFLMDSGLEMGLRPQLKIGDQRQLDNEKRNLLRKIFLANPQWSEILEIWRFSELLQILDEWASERIQKDHFVPWTVQSMRKEMDLVLRESWKKVLGNLQEIKLVTPNEAWHKWADNFPKALSGKFDEDVNHLRNWVEYRERKPAFRKASPPFSESLREQFDQNVEELDELLEMRIFDPEVQSKLEQLHGIFDPLAQEFAQKFLKLRLEKGLLGFNDLELFSLKMMREYPSHVAAFSKHWDYWLIDEYQDTSPLQVELLTELIGASPHYVVGDPQQSIYLFRGARVEVFETKQKELSDKKQNVILQMKNYRSRKEVLDFINHYFAFYGKTFGKMDVGSNLSLPGEPAADVIGIEKSEDEISSAQKYILYLLEKGIPAESICILAGTHQLLTLASESLALAGIDYQIHSQGKFFDRDEIVDALTILKFLSNPHDNKNFISLIRSPWFRIDETDILLVCKSGSYWLNACKLLSGNSVVQDLQDRLGRVKKNGYVDTLKNILLESGAFQSANDLDSTGQREANLWKLILDLVVAERKVGFSVSEYLRHVEETQNLSEGELEGDAAPFVEPKKVQLMTIHASKGLQFEYVVLLGYGRDQQKTKSKPWAFEEGVYSLSLRDDETGESIPSWLAHKTKKNLNRREAEEYLRVLYVAFTRAKQKIALFEVSKPRKSSWQSQFPGSWEQINRESKLVEKLLLSESFSWQADQVQENKSLKTEPFKSSEKQSVQIGSVTGQLAEKIKSTAWSPESFRKIQKGVDFHRLVEALKFEAVDSGKAIDPKFKKALKFVQESKEAPLMDLIRNGQVEWGFTVKRDGQIVRGQIDLWAWHNNQLWVADYKTGQSGDATEMAFQQVAAYASALQQIFPEYKDKVVNLIIIYPFEEKIVQRKAGDKK